MRRVLACSLVALATASAASCKDQENPEFPDVPAPPQDGGPDQVDAGPISITGDASKGILLEGTVIGEDGPFEGMVLIGTDGLIACAEPGSACADDPKAEGVAHAVIQGVIAPGLIDTHNHILFDIFDDDDWKPAQVYANHDEWPREEKYAEMVDVKQCLVDDSQGKPTWCPTRLDGDGSLRCEVYKFGVMKGVVAGTTSIVGLAGQSYPCFETLARAIDTQWNRLDSDKVQTSAIFPSKSSADGVCRNYASGKTDAYLIHVGEAVDDLAQKEWDELGAITTTTGCLYAEHTAITHGTGFKAEQFDVMKQKGMKLTWSPASNLALYGQTTNVPLALDRGIVVSIAPDWSMGGSRNMLDELRVGLKVSKEQWGGRLSPRDVFEMGTKNAAIVLNLQTRIGTLKKGLAADLFVVPHLAEDPYDSILAAKPTDVRITMVGGLVIYGDEAVRPLAAYGPACEDYDACGVPKFACAAIPGKTSDKLNQSFAQVKDLLEAALVEVDTVRADAVGDGLKFAPLTPVIDCGSK